MPTTPVPEPTSTTVLPCRSGRPAVQHGARMYAYTWSGSWSWTCMQHCHHGDAKDTETAVIRRLDTRGTAVPSGSWHTHVHACLGCTFCMLVEQVVAHHQRAVPNYCSCLILQPQCSPKQNGCNNNRRNLINKSERLLVKQSCQCTSSSVNSDTATSLPLNSSSREGIAVRLDLNLQESHSCWRPSSSARSKLA